MEYKFKQHKFHIILFIFCLPPVTNFNNGLEASSDSDDEDKLHIVEEDSLLEPDATDADGATPLGSHDAAITVLAHNGSWNGGEMEPRVFKRSALYVDNIRSFRTPDQCENVELVNSSGSCPAPQQAYM